MAHNFGNGVEVIWTDRKRIFGLPISLTKYSIIKKDGMWIKLVREVGLLHREVEEVQMYRVDDVGVFRSLVDWLWGVGTVEIYCSDASCKKLNFVRVRDPNNVRNIINDLVEEDRNNRNFHQSEIQY